MIPKSQDYIEDTNARRLLARMYRDVADLGKNIENLLTAANAMRLSLGAATLSLAEVEAMHVKQAHEKRVNDVALFEAQTKLSELLDAAKVKATQAEFTVAGQVEKVAGLVTQAKRMAEKDIVDDEPMGPLQGMEYVEIGYFAEQLKCSLSHVRNLISRGELPGHDAVTAEEGGRPKFLFLKHKAAVALVAASHPKKKGIAAIV